MTGPIAIGADIGGTFTDLVAVRADGTFLTRKVSSTTDDYARGIVEGLADLVASIGAAPGDVTELRHGTTVASNAILERKGARVGLITTKGFRDVLEIRTLRMPRLYDLGWEKPPVLVPRHLRLTVDERVATDGGIERPLDPAEAEERVRALVEAGVEAIAVCLLNAHVNPRHERDLAEIIADVAPDLAASISHQVLPEINEYNRVSTTVVNAYVKPPVASYLTRLEKGLDRGATGAPILLMQSNGGLTSAATALEFPMNIIESGPAGGVTGAQAIAARSGLPRIITFDMGGTTAKAALVEDGVAARASEYEVGGGIISGSRLLTGAGYMLKVPAVDLAEVGAGGGSIIRVDAGGALRIGPESAGAFPGPVAYDLGGDKPTITDANIVLGYLNPEYLVQGGIRLNAAKARDVLQAAVAEPLGLSVEDAAFGAHRIAASSMIQAIRAVSIERGRDPREFALFAFGGNGPLFAARMASMLSMKRVLIPPSPGVFSALGFMFADVEHHLTQSLRARLEAAESSRLEAAWQELETRGAALLAREGYGGERTRLARSASLRYRGQSFELDIPVAAGPADARAVAQLRAAFEAEHERTYGHRADADEPIEIVAVRIAARGLNGRALPTRHLAASGRPTDPRRRRVYFGPDIGWLETPVLCREHLGTAQEGPAIVEEYDATCLVPPGCSVELDAFGNIVMALP